MTRVVSSLLLCVLLLPLLAACATLPCRHPAMTEETIPPTCVCDGCTVHRCSDCGLEYIGEVLPATGHAFHETVISPDCVHAGYTKHTCTVCNAEYTDDFVDATGHTYGDWIVDVPATCGVSGSRHRECLVCKEVFDTENLPAPEHILTSSVTPPTCTAEGYTTYACASCDYSFRSDFVPPMGHTMNASTTYATLSHDGHTDYRCAHCEYSYSVPLRYGDLFTSCYVENTDILARGVDLSKYNHAQKDGQYLPFDFVSLKALGFDFVILKAGSGREKDPVFEADYLAAKAAGCDVGVYFFTYATTVEETLADADTLAGWLTGKTLEYPVFYDLEADSLSSLSGDALTSLSLAFVERMQSAGYYSALFVNNLFYQKLDKEKINSSMDVWYSRWPGTDVPMWNYDKYGGQLCMWQFTSSATLDGYGSISFDLDYAYKDFPTLIKAWHLNGY